MKPLAILGLPGAALLLTAEIAAPSLDLQSQDPAGPTAVMTPAEAPNAPYPLHDWTARILARPLFSPDRQPAPVPSAQPAHPANPPRLSGVISGPNGKWAIFQLAGAERSVAAAEGDAVGQWTVRNITAGAVIISHDQERLILHTTYAGTPAAPAPKTVSIPHPFFANPPYTDEASRIAMVAQGNHIWSAEDRVDAKPADPRTSP